MKTRAIAFCLALAGLLSIAAADPPKATVYGPTTGTAGELLTLDASQSEGAKLYRWTCDVDLADKRTFEPIAPGDFSKIRICTIPGKYVYTLAVANDDGIDLLNWTVTIPGKGPPCPDPPTPPPPTPGPGPAPPPTPPPPNPDPLPDGKFGISQDVAAWAGQVQTSNLKTECEALAEACKSVRKQLEHVDAQGKPAPLLTGAQEILQALFAANRGALGGNIVNWVDFGKKLSARIAAIYHAGRLATTQDWAALLGEIELGFRHATK